VSGPKEKYDDLIAQIKEADDGLYSEMTATDLDRRQYDALRHGIAGDGDLYQNLIRPDKARHQFCRGRSRSGRFR